MHLHDVTSLDLTQAGRLAVAVKHEDGSEPDPTYYKEPGDAERLSRSEQIVLAHPFRDRASLRRIIAALPEAIQIVDIHGHFILSNLASFDLVGFHVVGTRLPRTEQEVADVFGLQQLDGMPCPVAELPLQWTLRHGIPRRGVRLLMRHAVNGRRFPILANSAPLHDAAGALSGALLVFQDISSTRESEQQIIASMCHDLKDTLTVITMHSQRLQRRAESLTDPEAGKIRQGLQILNFTARRMSRQIGELVDGQHQRIGGDLTLNLLPIELVPLVQDLRDEYQQTTEQHAIHFEADTTSHVILGDAPRLERAVANVLSNALKFSPDGGEILVGVHATPGDGLADGAQVALTITDHGIGIPAEEVPRVSRDIFRGSNVAGAIAGTGHGLYSTRQIVEKHGGTLAIASVVGAGTTVTMRFPLAIMASISGD
jgi:signal transduction histidine kinase